MIDAGAPALVACQPLRGNLAVARFRAPTFERFLRPSAAASRQPEGGRASARRPFERSLAAFGRPEMQRGGLGDRLLERLLPLVDPAVEGVDVEGERLVEALDRADQLDLGAIELAAGGRVAVEAGVARVAPVHGARDVEDVDDRVAFDGEVLVV